MNPRNRWLLGLQWGACTWLAYVVGDAADELFSPFRYLRLRSIFELWGTYWWTPVSMLLFPGWLAVVALLVAGSRWARPTVVMMILARIAVDCAESHVMQIPSVGAPRFLPLLLPLLPLVVLRVEEPRVVLALAALGRWREALARSGGMVALLTALAVLSTRQATLDAVWGSPLTDAFRLPVMLAAAAGVITWVTRARRKRASATA